MTMLIFGKNDMCLLILKIKGFFMHKLYILPSDKIIFDSEISIDLFLNHLFKKSLNLDKSIKNNYFMIGEITDTSSGLFFDNDNILYHNKSKSMIKKNYHYSQLAGFVFYCAFYFIYENYLITNIISLVNEKILLNIDDELLNSITEDNGNELICELEKLLNDKKLTLLNFNNCEKNIKEILERTIQTYINKQFPSNNLISGSHSDENNTMYHIHKIIIN